MERKDRLQLGRLMDQFVNHVEDLVDRKIEGCKVTTTIDMCGTSLEMTATATYLVGESEPEPASEPTPELDTEPTGVAEEATEKATAEAPDPTGAHRGRQQ